jgi:hypothetical protein
MDIRPTVPWTPVSERLPAPNTRARGDEFAADLLAATNTGLVGEAMYSAVDGWHMFGVKIPDDTVTDWCLMPAHPRSIRKHVHEVKGLRIGRLVVTWPIQFRGRELLVTYWPFRWLPRS